MVPLWIALIMLVATSCRGVAGMHQEWSFKGEDRREFLIERFGFAPQAELKLSVSDVAFSWDNDEDSDAVVSAGLLFIHESRLWSTMAALQTGGAEDQDDLASEPVDGPVCLLQNHTDALWVDFTQVATWTVDKVVQDDEHSVAQPGFYYIFFAQCTDGLRVSFNMEATFRNRDGNFLSAGDSALPTVYLLTSLAFLGAAVAWARFLRANHKHIHDVHHMMSVLLALKIISLFAESMRFYYMKRHGDTLTNWTAVYYVFVFLKGIMLFVVLLLIGTGWSLLKAHLSRRDKSIISIVLVLQVLSNTAMIAVEESQVGTQSWVTWRDLLHIFDILCCFAILVPIVWSIRTLREAAGMDGKAHINLQKLTQFRSFYLIVVTYIYVTRIALYLLAASLPYNATWLSVVFSEGAALTFFVLTGYRFRPVDQNPYLEVSTHIDALDEFGLDDDDLELRDIPIQRKDHARFTLRPPSPRRVHRVREEDD
ncbi:hypothetical protein Poli38472_010741 [Pythium oligandrum]|uniref:Uncharacterized protein n=1 Tax=Pythium oligandrum TaxID=41045 RepID=A0A8K1FKF7_PYTOL|nr:hypothetical protein Poli38472_010741 [Pythium oligandrum]|eukprot:TMW61678.1 hypothetical protein Poli38472_010741 [Pythium oligandrum]